MQKSRPQKPTPQVSLSSGPSDRACTRRNPSLLAKNSHYKKKTRSSSHCIHQGETGFGISTQAKLMMGSRERKGTFLEERKLNADAARAAFNYQRCQEPKGVNSTPRKQPWAWVPVHSLRQHRVKQGGDGVKVRLITTLKDLKENLVVIIGQIETLGQETEAVDPVPYEATFENKELSSRQPDVDWVGWQHIGDKKIRTSNKTLGIIQPKRQSRGKA